MRFHANLQRANSRRIQWRLTTIPATTSQTHQRANIDDSTYLNRRADERTPNKLDADHVGATQTRASPPSTRQWDPQNAWISRRLDHLHSLRVDANYKCLGERWDLVTCANGTAQNAV